MTDVLLLPGWLDSGLGHWQTRWEGSHGDRRVQQDDWLWPRRGDWMARLEETLLSLGERRVAVAAHSLGCHLVAAWAARSRHTHRVDAALLVAPPDTAREDLQPQLHGWRSPPPGPLPFDNLVVCSDDDPFCSLPRTLEMAAGWGSSHRVPPRRGHLNADSGLGDWAEGRSWLLAMAASPG